MNKLLTVIVPVFRVENYIRKCLDSIINQTYKNLEIILIDDGSDDKSGVICDEYADKDKRIIVIHKENQGVSSARNKGLDIAKGEYITFVDPDDWIEMDLYENMIKNFNSLNADMSICGIENEYKNISLVEFNKKCVLELDNENAVRCLLNNKYFYGGVTNKVFRKNIISGTRFNSDIYIGEDLLFTLEVMIRCNLIVFSAEPGYHYLQRKASAMNLINVKKRKTELLAYKFVYKLIEEKLPRLKYIAWEKLLCKNIEISFLILQSINYRYQEALVLIRKNLINIIKNKNISFTTKLEGIIICFPKTLAYIICHVIIKNLKIVVKKVIKRKKLLFFE